MCDRTAETILKQENEKLINLNQGAYDSLKEKNTKLEKISNRLAKYLSPQIYKNIFLGCNVTKISALQTIQTAVWTRTEKLVFLKITSNGDTVF